jgi:DNA-binding transcriptional LysR family regulator
VLANRVRNQELDATIIAELPEPDVEMKSLRLIEEKMTVVAPPDYELSSWRAILTAYPFIRLNRHAGMDKVINSALKENQVQEAMELDSSEVVISMVNAGLGAGVIPAGLCARFLPLRSSQWPSASCPFTCGWC